MEGMFTGPLGGSPRADPLTGDGARRCALPDPYGTSLSRLEFSPGTRANPAIGTTGTR
jgi:hypothetical protein